MSIFTKPSFYALVATGLIIITSIVMLIWNRKSIMGLGTGTIFTVILLFGILVGVHGIQHLGLEQAYKYNDIEYILNKLGYGTAQ